MKSLKPLFELALTSFRTSGWRAWVTMTLFVFNGLGTPMFAWFLGHTVTKVSEGITGQSIALLAFGVGLFASSSMIISEIAWRSGQRVQEETAHQLERDILDLVMGVPTIDHHERAEYLDKLEHVRRERFILSMTVTIIFFWVSMTLQAIGTVLVLANIDPRLLLLIAFAIPQVWFSGRAEKRRVANSEKLQVEWHKSDMVVSLITEPSSAKEVRVFGLTPELLKRHRDSSDKSYDQEFHDRLYGAWGISAGSVLFALAFVGALGLVAKRVVEGDAQIGGLIAAVAVCGSLMAQATIISRQIAWLSWTLSALDRLKWLKDYGTEHRVTNPQPIIPVVKDRISFDHVSFAYPGNPEREILSDVSFDLRAGSTVAIIGDNGAGKSTIVKLLTGMYHPTSGAILLDGQPMNASNTEDWREHLSAAFQDHVRFETSAEQTIGLGDRDNMTDRQRIGTAVERGGAVEVIDRLPEGLDTQLGATWSDGVDLSGGQWQKLALARSMMRDPIALVLDEPTSALDAETEHALFERFSDAASEQRQRGMITVVVSHRFSTVRMADEIIVISGGTVAEHGSHDELMQKQGLYSELYNLQARAYQ